MYAIRSYYASFQAPTVRQTASATSSAFIDDPASPTGPGVDVHLELDLPVLLGQGADRQEQLGAVLEPQGREGP